MEKKIWHNPNHRYWRVWILFVVLFSIFGQWIMQVPEGKGNPPVNHNVAKGIYATTPSWQISGITYSGGAYDSTNNIFYSTKYASLYYLMTVDFYEGIADTDEYTGIHIVGTYTGGGMTLKGRYTGAYIYKTISMQVHGTTTTFDQLSFSAGTFDYWIDILTESDNDLLNYYYIHFWFESSDNSYNTLSINVTFFETCADHAPVLTSANFPSNAVINTSYNLAPSYYDPDNLIWPNFQTVTPVLSVSLYSQPSINISAQFDGIYIKFRNDLGYNCKPGDLIICNLIVKDEANVSSNVITRYVWITNQNPVITNTSTTIGPYYNDQDFVVNASFFDPDASANSIKPTSCYVTAIWKILYRGGSSQTFNGVTFSKVNFCSVMFPKADLFFYDVLPMDTIKLTLNISDIENTRITSAQLSNYTATHNGNTPFNSTIMEFYFPIANRAPYWIGNINFLPTSAQCDTVVSVNIPTESYCDPDGDTVHFFYQYFYKLYIWANSSPAANWIELTNISSTVSSIDLDDPTSHPILGVFDQLCVKVFIADPSMCIFNTSNSTFAWTNTTMTVANTDPIVLTNTQMVIPYLSDKASKINVTTQIYANSELYAQCRISDPDFPTQPVYCKIDWHSSTAVNNVPIQTDLKVTSVVKGGLYYWGAWFDTSQYSLTRGESIWATFTPYNDPAIVGADPLYGSQSSSSSIVIVDYLPKITSINFSSTTIYGGQSVTVLLDTFSDPIDGDNIYIRYEFKHNGQVISGDFGNIFPGEFVHHGDNISVRCQLYEEINGGQVFGPWFPTSGVRSIIILNSPPVISDLTLAPTRNGNDVKCSFSVSDADGDKTTLVCSWWKNGILITGQNGTTLPAKYVSRGDFIMYKAQAYDGYDNSATAIFESNNIVIQDALPVMTAVHFSASVVYRDENITVQSFATDFENDSIYYYVDWYVNNILVTGTHSETLSSDYFDANDEVFAIVFPFDNNEPMTMGEGLQTETITIDSRARSEILDIRVFTEMKSPMIIYCVCFVTVGTLIGYIWRRKSEQEMAYQ